MKTKSGKIFCVHAFLLLALIVFAINSQSFAQAKPKGKPWPAPEAAVKMKNPFNVQDSVFLEAKYIYAEHCKSCHGVKGKGDGTKAEKIDISCSDFTSAEFAKVSEGEAYWKTTEGRKPMPSFKEKLNDKERWAVVNYIRSLGKQKQ